MNQRAEIVAAIQKASTLSEQAALVSQLDAFDREQQARVSRTASVDMADTIVRDTLSPVAVHERSTIETDWLGQVESSHEDYANQISAEAALWFGRTSPEVRADEEEFREQARGMARRTASKYGEQAQAAEAQFLDYVGFLRTQAASGLPQVQQIVDSFENPAQTQLPTETFDNFAPEVHPLNQGVSGTETSERAPLIQEIESNPGNVPADADPSHHDETQQFAGPPPQQAKADAVEGPERKASKTAASEDDRCTCGAAGNLDEKGHTTECPARKNKSGYGWEKKGTDFLNTSSALYQPSLALNHVGNLDDFTAMFAKEAAEQEARQAQAAKEAASGLPQVQQEVDAFENPAPTPLPEEVAYPWELEEGQTEEERSDKKAAFQRRAAYVAGLMQQPFESLNEIERKEVLAFTATLQKRADQWTGGAPQSTETPVANNEGTTPEPPYGTYEQGKAEGRSDWPNEAPTYADDSSSAPPFVRGHSEGYQEAAQAQPAAPPGRVPPGARAASKTASKEEGFKVSASFTSPMETSDPQFAKGYKFATKWNPKKPLVRQGSVSFEAGLYAGLTDNPENQEAWVDQHQKAAKRYKDQSYLRRLSLHRSFSKRAVKHLEGLQVHGCYLRPVEAGKADNLNDAYTSANEETGNYNEARSNTQVTCSNCSGKGCKGCGNSGYMPKNSVKEAATTTDLDTGAPGSSPSPTGETPINGPGHTPPLEGQADPARGDGPAPYNGAEPFGEPAVPNHANVHGVPTAIDTTPGGPVDQAAYQRLSPQTQAFRKTVQANLLKSRQGG